MTTLREALERRASETRSERERLTRLSRMRHLGELLDLPAGDVRPEDVERALAGVSRGVRAKLLVDLRAVGVDVRGVRAPRPAEFQPPLLTEAEVRRLLREATRDRRGGPVVLALATGMRLGEILGLRWRDVAEDGAAVTVSHDLEWVPGQGPRLDPPKSHHSRRTVLLPDGYRLERPAGAGDDEFVFGGARPWHPRYVTMVILRRICRRAGVAQLRFHDLRHLHAITLMRAGVSPRVIAQRLGHANVAFTLARYSWATPDLQAEAARAASRLFRAAVP